MRAQRLFTYAEAAGLCAVSYDEVRRWVRTGKIRRVIRFGHRNPRIPEDELARMQQACSYRIEGATPGDE